jgi:hypothetical protein
VGGLAFEGPALKTGLVVGFDVAVMNYWGKKNRRGIYSSVEISAKRHVYGQGVPRQVRTRQEEI